MKKSDARLAAKFLAAVTSLMLITAAATGCGPLRQPQKLLPQAQFIKKR